jgi:hypothetical protein
LPSSSLKISRVKFLERKIVNLVFHKFYNFPSQSFYLLLLFFLFFPFEI